MTSFAPVMQQGDDDGTLACWWTDRDEDTDFCLCLVNKQDNGISFNMSYKEVKQLLKVINEKLQGGKDDDDE